MKVVHATWEKRNLGLDAWEVTVEADDFKSVGDMVCRALEFSRPGTYTVVKMPVGNLNAMYALEDAGFRFVETQMRIVCEFGRFDCPPLFKRMEDYLACEEAACASELWDSVIDKISDDMFISDRIYLDPSFPPGASATRYKNWLRDMRRDQSKHMIVRRASKDGAIVSFDVVTYCGPNAIGVLGGVYPDRQMLGIPHILSLFKYLRQRGYAKFVTHISSNNLPMMKVYAQLGGVTSDSHYVYRRIVPC